MALINCPECKKEISDKAQSCPHCGCPIKAVTIEQTSKKWKGIQLVGGIISILGLILLYPTCESDFIILSIFLIVIGFIILIVAEIGIWWYHR